MKSIYIIRYLGWNRDVLLFAHYVQYTDIKFFSEFLIWERR